MKNEAINTIELIETAFKNIDNEKVKRCAKFGLTMIEILHKK